MIFFLFFFFEKKNWGGGGRKKIKIFLTFFLLLNGRREAFATRPQLTSPSLPTKNEFQWLIPKHKNGFTTLNGGAATTDDADPIMSETKRKSPKDSIRSSDPMLMRVSPEISPFGSASKLSVGSRGEPSRRLRRSNSLNDVDRLKQEEAGRTSNGSNSNSGNSSGKENGRSRQGKRHVRKGSEQIEKAMSVHKIKASISDESAISRAKKKKFRDSKKRTSEEDPFSLLLGKNELFLKV